MACKMILELDVDLSCPTCYEKIKKAIKECCEKLKVEFDEKQNKVIISDPSDPVKLLQKLRCKVGCKIIKDYKIKCIPEKPEKPPPPPPPTKVQVEVAPVELRVCCKGRDGKDCSTGDGCHGPVCPRECSKGCDHGSCGKGGGCHGPVCSKSRCDGYCKKVCASQYYSACHYFSEENPTCTIM